MRVQRRKFLAAIAGIFTARLTGARVTPPTSKNIRKYTANATVTLLGCPIVSKTHVGSGYILVDETNDEITIELGAGSHPETARGLNRLGLIQENVVETAPGEVSECRYFAFMTASKEKNLDEARKALDNKSGELVPYTATHAEETGGRCRSRIDRLFFPPEMAWRDIDKLAADALAAIDRDTAPLKEIEVADANAPFLYAVRRALLDPSRYTRRALFFNSGLFLLETVKKADPDAGAHFAAKNLMPARSVAMRLDATLTDRRTNVRTPFRVWYALGCETEPPLRYEYQVRSFLRLTFEADPNANVPSMRAA
jgi:hypothetical protein